MIAVIVVLMLLAEGHVMTLTMKLEVQLMVLVEVPLMVLVQPEIQKTPLMLLMLLDIA